jgi:hypothetical protein
MQIIEIQYLAVTGNISRGISELAVLVVARAKRNEHEIFLSCGKFLYVRSLVKIFYR